MESITIKMILIIVMAVNIGTLSYLTIDPVESLSFASIDNPNTGGAVSGPEGFIPISNSNTAVVGPPGLSNNTAVVGPPGLSNANEALNNVYRTIIMQQQDHIQFLLDQQKTLRGLLINSSSS